jgi:hypothetical protein
MLDINHISLQLMIYAGVGGRYLDIIVVIEEFRVTGCS